MCIVSSGGVSAMISVFLIRSVWWALQHPFPMFTRLCVMGESVGHSGCVLWCLMWLVCVSDVVSVVRVLWALAGSMQKSGLPWVHGPEESNLVLALLCVHTLYIANWLW